MLRTTLFGICLLIGLVCSAQSNQRLNWSTLLQAVWDVGVVDPEKAEIENYLGNDPQSLIELPTETNWMDHDNPSQKRRENVVRYQQNLV